MGSTGNINFTGCSWDENSLILNNTQYGVSDDIFTTGENGAFTISIAFNIVGGYNSWANVVVVAISSSLSCSNLGDLFVLRIDTDRYRSISNIYTYFLTNNNALPSRGYGYGISTNKSYPYNTVIDLVYDGSVGRLYQNGALVGQVDAPDGASFKPSSKLSINCLSDSNGANIDAAHYSTKLYAINLYNRALSGNEVLQNFNKYNERFNLGL